jgi:hypothetical protein
LLVVNLYPSQEPWHTETLTAIHLPILLWMVTGARLHGHGTGTRVKPAWTFLRFTGESVIYGSLLLLGLMVLIMFTMMIFQSIGIDLEPFVENYLLIYGGCAMCHAQRCIWWKPRRALWKTSLPYWPRSSAPCSS